MKHLVIYHMYIPKIGGIETAVYSLAKILSEYMKVTVVYVNVEKMETILDIGKVCDIRKLDNDNPINCDVLLLASNHPKPKGIEAKKIYQWVHSDYEQYKITLQNRDSIDGYIAVSTHAAKVFKKMYNYDCTVIQNLVDPDYKIEFPKPLELITASRISPEKGFDRMLTFAQKLKQNGVNFRWLVFGDNSNSPAYEQKIKLAFADIPEVCFCGFKTEFRYSLAKADYLVQLSDFEGCPYSILEALTYGVPVITTDYPSAFELIIDGENGYILPMNMQIKEGLLNNILNKRPSNFTFSQKNEYKKWLRLM